MNIKSTFEQLNSFFLSLPLFFLLLLFLLLERFRKSNCLCLLLLLDGAMRRPEIIRLTFLEVQYFFLPLQPEQSFLMPVLGLLGIYLNS